MPSTRASLHRSLAGVLIVGGLLACAVRGAERTAQLSPAELDEAFAAFDVVAEVLYHPRCLNCHPAGERPLQYDTSQPHAMNVVRGEDDRGVFGMRCSGCHTEENPDVAHLPPGVSTGWRLAPRSMPFEGLSKAELARMLMDEERSHFTPPELLEHVAHDPLVRWGWDPGPGRTPVPVPHEEFVAAFRTWIGAGGPVPTEGNQRSQR